MPEELQNLRKTSYFPAFGNRKPTLSAAVLRAWPRPTLRALLRPTDTAGHGLCYVLRCGPAAPYEFGPVPPRAQATLFRTLQRRPGRRPPRPRPLRQHALMRRTHHEGGIHEEDEGVCTHALPAPRCTHAPTRYTHAARVNTRTRTRPHGTRAPCRAHASTRYTRATRVDTRARGVPRPSRPPEWSASHADSRPRLTHHTHAQPRGSRRRPLQRTSGAPPSETTAGSLTDHTPHVSPRGQPQLTNLATYARRDSKVRASGKASRVRAPRQRSTWCDSRPRAARAPGCRS